MVHLHDLPAWKFCSAILFLAPSVLFLVKMLCGRTGFVHSKLFIVQIPFQFYFSASFVCSFLITSLC